MARARVLIVLPLLATCMMEARNPALPGAPVAHRALSTIPASEVATWRRVSSGGTPDARFLQAVAFDETRNLVVVFGGTSMTVGHEEAQPNDEIWEWSPQTWKWANRILTGTAPEARAGAGMVYDPQRQKLVVFGGRSASGVDFDDTWEWDPTTGAWTALAISGPRPSGRCQLGMVYQKSTNKILLFGGGRADGATDATTVASSLGDTWELDPATRVWTELAPGTGPGVRHDFGMVWDAARSKVVLFGGMQIDIAGATGVPKQDTWEWDPEAGAWSERSVAGTKPSQRFGHAMAFDEGRGKVVVFGGLDMATAGTKNDLWEWEPTSAAWTRRLSGSETGVPATRSHAAMVSDGPRLVLFGGQKTNPPGVVITGAEEVWELAPETATFTDRTAAQAAPAARASHAMAYNPATGKVYVFGGWWSDYEKGTQFEDLWEWDGTAWTEVATSTRPSARSVATMAYDPARRSLILYGGQLTDGSGQMSDETWEWSSTTREWSKLTTHGNPGPLSGASMVTDTTRNRILLFGGTAVGSPVWPSIDRVWEWDGATLTWTERTAYTSSAMPHGEDRPVTGYDERRQKLLLYSGYTNEGRPGIWEWDPVTLGWAQRDAGEVMSDDWSGTVYGVYDPARRRQLFLLGNGANAGLMRTYEHDPGQGIWYQPAVATSPAQRYEARMVFDSDRGVAVFFGGLYEGPGGRAFFNDTWEYAVTGLGKGEGCTAATAATCASGYCVDGVCCESASCTGPCKSCNVAGSEGTCVLAQAGTEVPGSCADGQACDGTGSCKSRNGQACSAADTCASGFCADGVCCDSVCTGTCMACNLAARMGQCTPHPVGSDPNSDCGSGTDVCRSTCNGVGACAFLWGVSCGACAACDGAGTCLVQDPCGSMGGRPGTGTVLGKGGMPGSTEKGGAGGAVAKSGGAGGAASGLGGSGGMAGSGGSMAGSGGSAGRGGGGGSARGGAGGVGPGLGGSAGSAPTVGQGGSGGGATSTPDGSAGSAAGAGGGLLAAGGSGGGAVDGGQNVGLTKSGCSCALGQGAESRLGSASALLVALSLLRRRRRRQ